MVPGQIKKYEVFVTLLYDGFICDNSFLPNINQLRQIIDQLFSGLEQLIRANKCHNDIKPTNILYFYQNNEYKIKIGDFAQCGTHGGTPGWTAPVFLKDREPGKEDMYSLGLVILRLLCADQNLFHCLRDNFITSIQYRHTNTAQRWMINFKNMSQINLVLKMMDLVNQPSFQEVQNEWNRTRSWIKVIDVSSLLQLSVPRQYLQPQYIHTV